jgi:uncharacterized protein YceK
MKVLALTALVLLALAGCSTVPPSTVSEIDYAKMASIERAAAKNGVKVIWVSAPRKLVSGG